MSADHQSAAGTVSRRGFLGLSAAALAGVMLAPGVRLIELAAGRAPSEPATRHVRWGMLIDTNQCDSGCTDCVSACNTENGLSGRTLETDSQWIRKMEVKDLRGGKAHS